MAIFDLEKDDLLRLSDTQLEELIALLAEAEVATQGHSPARVSWSGSIKAPDEGIDIHVQVPAPSLDTGFLARPDTILQSKRDSMPKSAILDEMLKDGELNPTISHQAKNGGSYIMVSLADDCSPPMKKDRLTAMRATVANDPNSNKIHLDFYDRSKLLQWLRQHPSVMLWAKSKLGQGYSGWQPYGAWSNPPKGADDTLISAPGVSVNLPSERGQKLTIEDAIDPMRELIRSTSKAVRVTGLSGVGKTRIVQALFDETVGNDPLDRTIAVYVDTGAEPDPSASAMLDRLIAEGRRAVMILDNCPSDLHSSLAGKVSISSSAVSLITVEYDIRDDKPQTTEVIHIEAAGPEVAEQLVIRRFPTIGQNNARRIAEFADGNARVSLAIAEQVEQGETLAQLSDAQLFDRLFEQRKQPDDDLRSQAETLSLVYSFSVSNPKVGQNELEVLGSISGHSQAQLFRSVKKLLDRHVVQKRSHWRAILPHAIANRLASSALDSTPVDTLRATFEAPGHQRLLMSFAHRLGLLHDHPVATEIVEDWLQPDGLLGQISTLDDTGARILEYIGPVAPDLLLDRIETEIEASGFQGLEPIHNPRRATILNLLQSMAYEPNAFDRCIRLLIRVADFEDESSNYDSVRDKIIRFFQAYLSGTHATLEQRVGLVQECIQSENPKRRSLGIRLLSRALEGFHWNGSGLSDFGARPRDYGYRPDYDQLASWRKAFVEVAVRLGTDDNPYLADSARSALAQKFRGLWRQQAMHDSLVAAARAFHDREPWGEGWRAIRSTIYFDYKKRKPDAAPKPIPNSLAALEADLEPRDLLPMIKTYVLDKSRNNWALDEEFDFDDPNKYSKAEERIQAKAVQLGEDFSLSGQDLAVLGPALFQTDWMPNRSAFGRGLAKGAVDLEETWRNLVEQFEACYNGSFSISVLCGFLEEVDKYDPELARRFLDQCAAHEFLRQIIVGLHPARRFDETDLDRCMAVLDDPNVSGIMYDNILWQDTYAGLPKERVIEVAKRIIAKPNGDEAVLNGLSMKLHREDSSVDTLGVDLRRLGLVAATQLMLRDNNDPGGSIDHHMECVVRAALRFDGNEKEKQAWLEAIFNTVDDVHGHLHAFGGAVRTTVAEMPNEFLDRVFSGDEETRERRRFFIERGEMGRLPLAQVNIDTLIAWCQRPSEHDVWSVVGSCLDLWQNEKEGGVATLSDAAMTFLEAAPDPRSVLNGYASRMQPHGGWSSTQADAMQQRADAILALASHSDAEIAVAAKVIAGEANEGIERIRRSERQRDEAREQTFE